MRTLPTPFDPHAGIPDYLYVKLADYFADRIADGTFPLGSQLPNERTLAAEFEVAVTTVRKARWLLRDRGLVVTVPGRGIYVVARGCRD